jgi:ComF family protein
MEALLDLVYPPACHICGSPLLRHEAFVCMHCFSAFPRTDHLQELRNEGFMRLAPHVPVYQVASYFRFGNDGAVRNLIHEMKYAGQPLMAEWLGEKMCQWLEPVVSHWGPEAIVPVPMHPRKIAKRGFNQAEALAEPMAKNWGIPLASAALQRSAHTEAQAGRRRWERWLHSKEVFGKGPKAIMVSGLHVLLVDDVLTTGATLEECTRLLYDSGARLVSIATLAIAQ